MTATTGAKAPTDQQTAVSAALERFGVSCVITSIAPNRGHGPEPITRDNNWKCYPWVALFTYKNARISGHYSAEYYTGTGHVTYRGHKTRPPAAIAGRPGTLFAEQWDRDNARPTTPHVADVVYSLVLDGRAIDQSFSDWCADMGADTDSLKALRTYETCCAIGTQLRKMFTREQLDELETLLQDY